MYVFLHLFFFLRYKSEEKVNKKLQLMTIITLLSNIIYVVSFCDSFAIKM